MGAKLTKLILQVLTLGRLYDEPWALFPLLQGGGTANSRKRVNKQVHFAGLHQGGYIVALGSVAPLERRGKREQAVACLY